MSLSWGQLIFNGSLLAAEHGYPPATFMYHVRKLEEMGEITIEDMGNGVRVLTVMHTFTYDKIAGKSPAVITPEMVKEDDECNPSDDTQMDEDSREDGPDPDGNLSGSSWMPF